MATYAAAGGVFDPWSVVNHRLTKAGYTTVNVKGSSSINDIGEGYAVLDQLAATSLRSTLLSILDDLERKEAVIQNVLRESQNQQTQNKGGSEDMTSNSAMHFGRVPVQQALPKTPIVCSPIKDVSEGHELKLKPSHTEEQFGDAANRVSVIESLRSRISELEYANAKLTVELQNRPKRKEWKISQKKLEQVEHDLDSCRQALTYEQVKCAQLAKDLQAVYSVSGESTIEGVLRVLHDHQQKVECCKNMEKFIVSVLAIVDDTSAPRPPDSVQEAVAPPHKPWCHVTWRHVIPTLRYWLTLFEDLQELHAVFCEVLDGTGKERDGSTPRLSCAVMATLLRRWLGKTHNYKVAKSECVSAMLVHFQKLFDVRDTSGICTRMSDVYCKLSQYQNAIKTLQSILNISSPSLHSLVAHVELLSSSQCSRFWQEVHRNYGYTTADEVMKRLHLAEAFLPAFQDVVCEIQCHFGVTSLGALVPALQDRLHMRS